VSINKSRKVNYFQAAKRERKPLARRNGWVLPERGNKRRGGGYPAGSYIFGAWQPSSGFLLGTARQM
jgi:hypothetical protein